MSGLQAHHISTVAFWDIDSKKLNLEQDSLTIISRVFNYGKWSDIQAVLSYYGNERIKKEIVQATWLKKSALSFVCLIFGLQKQDFTAINNRKSSIWNQK